MDYSIQQNTKNNNMIRRMMMISKKRSRSSNSKTNASNNSRTNASNKIFNLGLRVAIFVLLLSLSICTIVQSLQLSNSSKANISFTRRHSFSAVSSNAGTSFTTSKSSSFYQSVNYLILDTQQEEFDNNNRMSRIITMGKGDGKKKRKKKTSNAISSTESSTATTPPPQRVTNDINIPVRHQIRWAQRKKEAARNSGTAFRQTNVKRTSYRKSLDEEEIEQAKLERKRKGQEPDWDVILSSTSTSPLVIVDAYNIIHKWPRLKKWMNKGMISKARDILIHDMEELRVLKGWRLELVFDGYGRNVNGGFGDGPGGKSDKITKSDQQASKKVTDHGVRIVYSGAGMSADNYIESRCYDAKKVTDGKLSGSLIVASDDSMIRCAAANAGALCMSAGRMVDELKAQRKATSYRVEAAVAKVNGHDVRPVQLRGKAMPNTFMKGSLIIEDKRNRPKKTKKKEEENTKTIDDLKTGTKSIPSWAIIPEQDK